MPVTPPAGGGGQPAEPARTITPITIPDITTPTNTKNTYGNNGNRWWVAYNTAQQSVVPNPVKNPGSEPSGYEALPSGNAADDIQFANAAKATAKAGAQPAGKGPTISVENITWSNVNGPYTSKAKATAAIKGIQKKEPAPGEKKQLEDKIPGVSDIQNIDQFLGALASANLWIRVAKVLAGGVILTVGLVKITGLESKVGPIASKAVAIAPFL